LAKRSIDLVRMRGNVHEGQSRNIATGAEYVQRENNVAS